MKNRILLLFAILFLRCVVIAHSHYLLAGLYTHASGAELDTYCSNRYLADKDLPKQHKRGKKIPLKGFQIGYSQHELFLSSLNIGYLTDDKFGVDFSARSPIFFGFEVVNATIFIGPVYQIGDSRFFAKGGAEFIFTGGIFDEEDSQDDSNLGVAPYLGAKYLLPITRSLGFHAELGAYTFKFDGTLTLLPSIGVGIVVAPFGVR